MPGTIWKKPESSHLGHTPAFEKTPPGAQRPGSRGPASSSSPAPRPLRSAGAPPPWSQGPLCPTDRQLLVYNPRWSQALLVSSIKSSIKNSKKKKKRYPVCSNLFRSHRNSYRCPQPRGRSRLADTQSSLIMPSGKSPASHAPRPAGFPGARTEPPLRGAAHLARLPQIPDPVLPLASLGDHGPRGQHLLHKGPQLQSISRANSGMVPGGTSKRQTRTKGSYSARRAAPNQSTGLGRWRWAGLMGHGGRGDP